jgi:hypothetical protein
MIIESILVSGMIGLVLCANKLGKKARNIRKSHNYTPKHPRVK